MEKEKNLRHRTHLVASKEGNNDLDEPPKVGLTTRMTSLRRLVTGQTVLFKFPILALVAVASLDNADKQLLASSFPMLEKTLGLDVRTLGYFSLFTNLSYALSLPFWGYMVHSYGMQRIHILLSTACISWGLATAGIAMFGKSVIGQAIFRALNGIALGSILPLSQTLLVEMVDVSMRGRAFGFMSLCEKLSGTLAAASIVYLDPNWEYPYWGLGVGSIVMGYVCNITLHPSMRGAGLKQTSSEDEKLELTLRQIIQRIVQLPAFLCMVVQGVFGGTPWDMMSFLLLLMDWRGFTKKQIVTIQFTSGLTSTVGGWLGGILGDYASQRFEGTRGRVLLAFVSVIGGIPLYGLFLNATDYYSALLWLNAFQLWGTWTPTGACRPICADLTRNASERAQIIALWIVLEKASGAIFGAPLVGYLTSSMLSSKDDQQRADGGTKEKAQALAWNIFFLSSLFWSICAFFWVLMSFTIPKNRQKHRSTKESDFELNPLV